MTITTVLDRTAEYVTHANYDSLNWAGNLYDGINFRILMICPL